MPLPPRLSAGLSVRRGGSPRGCARVARCPSGEDSGCLSVFLWRQFAWPRPPRQSVTPRAPAAHSAPLCDFERRPSHMAAPGTSSAVLPFLSGLPSFGTLIGDRLIAPEVATIHYVPSKDTSPPQVRRGPAGGCPGKLNMQQALKARARGILSQDQVLHADTQNALVRALAAKRLRDEVRPFVFPSNN